LNGKQLRTAWSYLYKLLARHSNNHSTSFRTSWKQAPERVSKHIRWLALIIELEQRTLGKKIWAPDDAEPDPAWPTWTFQSETLSSEGDGLVVAVSLTHDTAPRVRDYVRASLPTTRSLLVAVPNSGPGARSVVCGRHAFDLAESLAAKAKTIREKESLSRIHLFIAGPGAFAFYLGERQVALGATTLYEF
jgi:hypothetical protein